MIYEPFNYAVNTALQNQSGGSGWSGPWLTQSNNMTTPGYSVAAGNLSYSNLQTIGNQGSGGSAYLSTGRLFDISASGALAPYIGTNGGIGKVGTTVWFSILLNKNTNNDDPMFTELNGSPDGWVIGSFFPHAGIGYYGTSSNVSGERRWSLRINNIVYPSSKIVTTGATTLAVMSVTFGASSHTLNVYFDPVLGTTPPTPNLTQTATGDLYFRGFAFYGEAGNGVEHIDEIRLASSYQCVAPDNTVPINAPPTAAFSMSTASGVAPLTVSFDALGSSDPDGTIVSYEWNFGDGSPLFTTASPSAFSHIFTTTGVLNISLKVTDNLGATNTTTQQITVSPASGGGFSCQAAPVLARIADCGVANGRIEVQSNSLSFSHSLQLNGVGTLLTSVSNIYNGLAAGNYVLKTWNSSGCAQDFNLTVPTDSATCVGWSVKSCRTQVGMNLNFPTYYTTERPFKNLFRFNSGLYSAYLATP